MRSIASYQAEALFTMAGFEVWRVVHCPNEYFRAESNPPPWFMVVTDLGRIKIGWRKRVLSIEWPSTKLECHDLTTDEVTKWEYGVHAWRYSSALKYLETLREKLEQRVRYEL